MNYDGLLATGRVLFYTLHNGSYVRNMTLLMVGYVEVLVNNVFKRIAVDFLV